MQQDFGVIGLAVMGENLVLNLERNGFSVAVYNRSSDRTQAFLQGRGQGKKVHGTASLPEFVSSLQRPRRILVMVKAGPAVDEVIAQLRPHLEPDDILIDGGNSHYRDTDRRLEALASSGIVYFGMGVSGGEEGALWGPSLMPGGDESHYPHLEPILTKIAATTDTGPCVTYVGAGSAGHFVKMVHNGIEYADMQLIAEAYDLLRHGLGLGPPQIAEVFARWNDGELQSFLIEITSKIVDFPDDQGGDGPLVDHILDHAGEKGTGRWTTTAALELNVCIPTITTAVDQRILSGHKIRRREASKLYGKVGEPALNSKPGEPAEQGQISKEESQAAIARIGSALYASKICSYAQGFDLLHRASLELSYGLQLDEIARIWKGGCIIRARFLDLIREAFMRNPGLENLLLDPRLATEIQSRIPDWRRTIGRALHLGIALPAMSASLAYFDSLRRERLPANLIQAQRDYFGAHTYARLDRPGTFHTDWSRRPGKG